MRLERTRREFLAAAAGMTVSALWLPGRRVLAQEGAHTALPADSERRVREYMSAHSVPGLQLTFARGARVLYEGGFGKADREADPPVTRESPFRIASCSKALTAVAIFRLVEAGKVRLEDRVFGPEGILEQFREEVPHRDWVDAITVHQLLTHTCGGWSNAGNDPMFEQPELNHEQLIAWTLRTHSLQDTPGEKYAYSNFGYSVLGRVIEHVSEQPYARFVHEEVLQRARIHDMRIATHEPAPHEVHYYAQGDGDPYRIPISRMDSHGGWIATATDLATLLACLFTPVDEEGATAMLTADSLREMTTGSRANSDYACGLAVNKAGNAWHTGSLPGTMSLMVHTKSGMSWAVVMNTRSAKPDAGLALDRLMWEIAKSVPEWKA